MKDRDLCSSVHARRRLTEDRTSVPNMLVYNRVLTILGMVPQFVLVDEARASNALLHVYNHDCAELRFQRQF